MKRPPHILVAEDEDLIAMALAEILRAEGYRITVTYNGQQALETDVVDPADILLTDMRMPVMDGSTLIHRIRQRCPDLPIIVFTGYSQHIPAEEPGRLVVLRKPFALSVLIRHVKTLLTHQVLQDNWVLDEESAINVR